jgi:hypothetical protein
VRQAGSVTQADAYPLGGREGAEGVIQVKTTNHGGLSPGSVLGQPVFVSYWIKKTASAPALYVMANRYPTDPPCERPLAPELGYRLEGGEEGVLSKVVGEGGMGAHATQETADARPMAAREFAKRRSIACGGERG